MARPHNAWETKRISVPVALIQKVKQMIKIWERKKKDESNNNKAEDRQAQND